MYSGNDYVSFTLKTVGTLWQRQTYRFHTFPSPRDTNCERERGRGRERERKRRACYFFIKEPSELSRLI